MCRATNELTDFYIHSDDGQICSSRLNGDTFATANMTRCTNLVTDMCLDMEILLLFMQKYTSKCCETKCV